MPLYTFHCSNCHEIFDEVRTIATRDKPAECPKCHCESPHDWDAELQQGRHNRANCVVWLSEAMGCQPSEVAEFQRAFPGSEYTPDGRLVCRGLKHRESEMRKRGYVDFR